MLVRTHHDHQAMLEYRTAVGLDSRLIRPVVEESMDRWPTFAELQPMVDVASPPLDLWDLLSTAWVRQNRAAEAEASDTALLQREPLHEPALYRQGKLAMSREDFDVVRATIAKMPPEEPTTALLQAELASKLTSDARAVELLEQALRTRPGEERLLAALVQYQEREGDLDGARQALADWERVVPRRRLSKVLLLRAGLEDRAGRPAEAMQLYRRALYYGAGNQALLGVARIAEQRGQLNQALNAYRKIAASGEENRMAAEKVQQIEARINQIRFEGTFTER